MNRYEYSFAAKCPTNGESISYDLEIETGRLIPVEEIKAACAVTAPTYHEPLADELLRQLGGRQTMTALHHGVRITTSRN